jgi:hypothetical protein
MPIFKQLGSPDIRLLTVTINEPITLHYIVRHDKLTAEPILLFLLREIDSKVIRPNSFSDSPGVSEQSARTTINSTCKDHLWTTPDELRALKCVQILPVRAPKAALISSIVLIDLLRHFEMDIKACALEATLICLQSEANMLHRLFLGLKGAIAAANYKFKIPSFDSTTVNLLKKLSPSYPPPYQPYHFNRSYHTNTNVPALDVKTALLLGHLLHHPKLSDSVLSWVPLLKSHSRIIEECLKAQSFEHIVDRYKSHEKNKHEEENRAVNQDHNDINDSDFRSAHEQHPSLISWRRHVVAIEAQISSPLASTPISMSPNAALNGSPFAQNGIPFKSPFQPKAVISNPAEPKDDILSPPQTTDTNLQSSTYSSIHPPPNSQSVLPTTQPSVHVETFSNSTFLFKVATIHTPNRIHIFIGFSTACQNESPSITRSPKDRFSDSSALSSSNSQGPTDTENDDRQKSSPTQTAQPQLLQDYLTSDLIPVAPPQQDHLINYIIHVSVDHSLSCHRHELDQEPKEEIQAAKILSTLFPFSTATYIPLSSQFFKPVNKPQFNRSYYLDNELQGIFFPYKPISLSFTVFNFIPPVPAPGCYRFHLFGDYPYHIVYNPQTTTSALASQFMDVMCKAKNATHSVLFHHKAGGHHDPTLIDSSGKALNLTDEKKPDTKNDHQVDDNSSSSNTTLSSNHTPLSGLNGSFSFSPPVDFDHDANPTPTDTDPTTAETAPTVVSKYAKALPKAKRGRKSKAELESLKIQKNAPSPSPSNMSYQKFLIKFDPLVKLPDGHGMLEGDGDQFAVMNSYSASTFTEFAVSHFGSDFQKKSRNKICLDCAKFCTPMLNLPFLTESGNIKRDDGSDEHELIAMLRRKPRYCDSIQRKSFTTSDPDDKCECLCHVADMFLSQEGGENSKNEQVGLYGKNNHQQNTNHHQTTSTKLDNGTHHPPSKETKNTTDDPLAPPTCAPPRSRTTPHGFQFLSLAGIVPFPLLSTVALSYFHARASPGLDISTLASPDYSSEVVASGLTWLTSQLKRPITFSSTLIEFPMSQTQTFFLNDTAPDFVVLSDTASHRFVHDKICYRDSGDTETDIPPPIPSLAPLDGSHYLHPDNLAQVGPGLTSDLMLLCVSTTGWMQDWIKDDAMLGSYYPKYKITPEIALYQNRRIAQNNPQFADETTPSPRTAKDERDEYFTLSESLFPYEIKEEHLGVWRSFLFHFENLDPLHRFRLLRHSHCIYNIYPHKRRGNAAKGRRGSVDDSPDEESLQHSHKNAQNVSNPVIKPGRGVADDQTMDSPVPKRPLQFDSDDLKPQNGDKNDIKDLNCNNKRQRQKSEQEPNINHLYPTNNNSNAIFVQLEGINTNNKTETKLHHDNDVSSLCYNPHQSSIITTNPNGLPPTLPQPQFEPPALIPNSSIMHTSENIFGDLSGENSSRNSPAFNSLSFFDSDLYSRSEHSESSCNTNNNESTHAKIGSTKNLFNNNHINNRTTSNLSYESSYQTGLMSQLGLFGFELPPLTLNNNSTPNRGIYPSFDEKQIETTFSFPFSSQQQPLSPNYPNLPLELNNNSPSYRFNPPSQHYRPQTPLQFDSPRLSNNNHNNNNPSNNSPSFGSLWSGLFSSPTSQSVTLSSFFDSKPQTKPSNGNRHQ